MERMTFEGDEPRHRYGRAIQGMLSNMRHDTPAFHHLSAAFLTPCLEVYTRSSPSLSRCESRYIALDVLNKETVLACVHGLNNTHVLVRTCPQGGASGIRSCEGVADGCDIPTSSDGSACVPLKCRRRDAPGHDESFRFFDSKSSLSSRFSAHIARSKFASKHMFVSCWQFKVAIPGSGAAGVSTSRHISQCIPSQQRRWCS